MMSLFDLEVLATVAFTGAFGVRSIQVSEFNTMISRTDAAGTPSFSRKGADVTAASRGYEQGKQ